MSRRRSTAAPAAAPQIHSLSRNQARWLAEARATAGGAYVGMTSGLEPYELVEAGAATWREVRRSEGTRGPHDPQPCEWTDCYLVPTEHGLALLAKSVSA